MRKLIVIALLAVSANCHAMDILGISIADAMRIVQQRRVDQLEQQLQLQEQARRGR
jgi:hypothetical protein